MKEEKAKSSISVLVNIVSTVVLVFSIIICVLIIISLKSSSGVAQIFGYTVFSVQSDSMEPLFFEDDLIVVRCTKPTDRFEVGDVVSYHTYDKAGTRFVNTHRVVKVLKGETRDRYLTQGDNAPQMDEKKLSSNNILGVYTGKRVSGLGKVIDFINSPTGVLLCVVIPSAIIIIAQIFSSSSAAAKRKREMLLEAQEQAQRDRIQLVNEVIAAQRGVPIQPAYAQPIAGSTSGVTFDDAEKQRVIQEFLTQKAEEEAKKQAIIEEYLQKQKEAEQAAKEEAEAAKIKAIIAEFLAQQKAGETTQGTKPTSDSEENKG